MEKQSKHRHRTSKNKTKQKQKDNANTIIIDNQTQTTTTMRDKGNKKQRIKQSNKTPCSTTQGEDNLQNTPRANTPPQDDLESNHPDHEIPSQTHNRIQVNRIDNILPSDADYEWWIYNHNYMSHQSQKYKLTYLYEEPSYNLLLLTSGYNFIAGFFQDESLNNLTTLSQTSQKNLLELSKGYPDLPMLTLHQLYGILTSQPLQPRTFIHLIYQLIMEITPGHLTEDINLICLGYPEKIIAISEQKQTNLNDFGTIQLGQCCNLILETPFCYRNHTQLLFHKEKNTYIFPLNLPDDKYRVIIADIKYNTLTYYTTEHNMTQSEQTQAQKIMKALDKNIQSQKLEWAEHFHTYDDEITIHKLKHSYKKVGSLTCHNVEDTGFLIYYFLQQFILNKKIYPTMDLPLIRKQVAIQLTLNKYTEFVPIYTPLQ